MNVNGVSGAFYGVDPAVSNRRIAQAGNRASGFRNRFQGTFTLVMGGLSSRGLSDGGCTTVYKADGYSAEHPVMRVVTRSADGQEYEQMIDPTKVNPASATRTEIDALTAYLVDEKKLDSASAMRVGAGAGMGTDTFSGATMAKRNYYALAEEMMQMQYQCHNYAGYASYQKIAGAFAMFMGKD